jgi:septum formation protein
MFLFYLSPAHDKSKEMNRAYNLTLASGSPRRKELLRLLVTDFQIRIPSIDETPRPDEPALSYVERLAQEKAESLPLQDHECLLAADTIVHIETRLLGKPTNTTHAMEMLELLAGKPHQVSTGVCLRTANANTLFSVTTDVIFRTISREEIETYVATGCPMDKAGAYAIQGGAAAFVREIHGSYTNVVGLPLCEVSEALSNLG